MNLNHSRKARLMAVLRELNNFEEHNSIAFSILVLVAFVTSIIIICLIRKHVIRRTPFILILLNFSIIQVPILYATLVQWISTTFDLIKGSLHISWITSFLISARIPVNIAIAMLALDKFFYIKNSTTYETIISLRRINGAFFVSWALWVVSFTLLELLRSYEFIHVVPDIIFPIKDCSILLFLICIEFYTWCARKRRRLAIARSASTIIIISHGINVLLPSVIVLIG